PGASRVAGVEEPVGVELGLGIGLHCSLLRSMRSPAHDNCPVRRRHLGPERRARSLNYALLTAGVTAVSFSAIFIRLAHAPPMAMAFWRNLIATAMVVPFALGVHRSDFRALSRRD